MKKGRRPRRRPRLKLSDRAGPDQCPVPGENALFPAQIAGFLAVSRPVPVYPVFLNYVVPVHLILLSSSLNVTMDYIIYGYEDTEPKTPEQLLEMEAVEELLGHCSEKKRSYAMELLRLFLKACDEK